MAKKEVAVAMVISGDDSYAKAEAKAANPAMTTKNNPLAEPVNPSAPNPALVHHNMERLMEDAHKRRCPTHGGIYSAIMDNRYGG